MFNIHFDLAEGGTIVVAEHNKMYCSSIAKQLHGTDGGVFTDDLNLNKYVNIIYLFKDNLVVPPSLEGREDIIYYDISYLMYSENYWHYIQTTQSLLDELTKLLPVDNLVRVEREKFRREYQEAELARVSQQATTCCTGH